MRTTFVIAFLLAASVALAEPAATEPYKVGSVLPAIELSDQHGESRTIDESVRAIVFSRDMKAGDAVKAAVAKAGSDLFDRNGAVYVVDVKGMPAIIRTLFAMPAMRRRPYRLLVDTEGTKTAEIPGGATYPTVLILEKLHVTRVQFPESEEALIKAIEKPAE